MESPELPLRPETMVRPDPPAPKIELPDPPLETAWGDAKGFDPEHAAGLPTRKTGELREARHRPDPPEESPAVIRIELHEDPHSYALTTRTIEVQEISNTAVRLDHQDPVSEKVIHQAVLEKRGEDPRIFDKFFGQGEDWGEATRFSIRWISLFAILIVAIVVAAMLYLPKVNQKNPPRKITTIPTLTAEAQAETLDSLAMRKILDHKEQAMAIFSTYAKASEVAEFLPHLFKSSEMEDTLRSHWIPLKARNDWSVPKNADWKVAGTSTKPLGLLQSTLPDYSKFHAYFVYQNEQVLLDWKATAGYGTATFEQLKDGRGNGLEIRGMISPLSFYTRQWPESTYKCYQLLGPDGETAIWCYTKRDEPVSEIIESLFQTGVVTREAPSLLRITLRLEPGGEGSMPSQWLIKEMYQVDWIEP